MFGCNPWLYRRLRAPPIYPSLRQSRAFNSKNCFASDTSHDVVENKAAKTGQTKEAVLEAMKNQVPMKRIAEAQEVANAIAFLASPAASYINGINVPVDGGRTACL